VTEILRIQVTSVLMRKIFSPKNAAKKCLDWKNCQNRRKMRQKI
jgi:hypothetical protein